MATICRVPLAVSQEKMAKPNLQLRIPAGPVWYWQIRAFYLLIFKTYLLRDRRIHILGSFQNIKIARDALCSLILGSPPGKVYAHLRTVAGRMRERF